MNYVCGFLFSFDIKNFVLIKKNRGPEGMAGKWNGVGGKLELVNYTVIDGLSDLERIVPLSELINYPESKEYITRPRDYELPHVAMEREFSEETGVLVKADRWRCFYIEEYSQSQAKIYYFAAFGDDYKKVRTVTDEEVKIHGLEDFAFMHPNELVHNLNYIISMVVQNVHTGYFQILNPQGVNGK